MWVSFQAAPQAKGKSSRGKLLSGSKKKKKQKKQKKKKQKKKQKKKKKKKQKSEEGSCSLVLSFSCLDKELPW